MGSSMGLSQGGTPTDSSGSVPWNSGLNHEWGVDLYGHLLEIGGGKERMTKYFKVTAAEQLAMRMWVLRQELK